nr:regulatory protein RecX [Maliibacterium massiliense]
MAFSRGKKPVDPAECTYERGIAKALSLLEYRWRTRQEMQRALAQRGYSQEVVQQVLSQLEAWGYLDDARFAEQFVRGRLERGDGARMRLRQSLGQKGVPDDVLREALDQIPPEKERALALAQARKLWRRYDKEAPRVRAQKTAQALARKGYPWPVASDALRALARECQQDGLLEDLSE